MVSAQAGPALLHVDGLRARGILVPELTAATQQRLASLLPPLTYQANPVDTGRPGPAFAEVLGAVAADPGVGLVSVYALAEPDALDLPGAVAQLNASSPDGGPRALVAAIGGPPGEVTAQRAALRDLGVPVLASPRALTTAVAALSRTMPSPSAGAHPAAGLDPAPGPPPGGPHRRAAGRGPGQERPRHTGHRHAATPGVHHRPPGTRGAGRAARPGGGQAARRRDRCTSPSAGGVLLGVRDAGGTRPGPGRAGSRRA